MKRFLDNHALSTVFAVGIGVCLSVGYVLEHKAFTPASPPGQASVVVFVQDPAAALDLTATVSPDSPWRDKLTVHVQGAPLKRNRWLLVIECPPGSANPPHAGTLVSEPVTQTLPPASVVTAYSGAGRSRTVKLGCFIQTRSNSLNQSSTPEYASIGSVTLPALETDQAIEDAVTAPTLYVDQKTSAGPIHLMQVFPGATCPSPAPAVTPSAAIPSTSPSASAAGSPRPQPSSAPAASPTAASSPGIPGCFGQASADTNFSAYYLPSSMQTKEILTNVDLTGYQVESIFPPPADYAPQGQPGPGRRRGLYVERAFEP